MESRKGKTVLKAGLEGGGQFGESKYYILKNIDGRRGLGESFAESWMKDGNTDNLSSCCWAWIFFSFMPRRC